MNFRIVLHLLKTDWQRLKRPLIGLWILVFLTALPWWFSDPLGFTLPAYWNSGGSGNWIDGQRERLYSNPWVKEPLIWSNLARLVMTLGIAAAIGMARQANGMIQPVRRRERAAATTLGLLLLLVAPQGVVLAVNLFIHRFSPGVVAAATLDHFISATLILGTAALWGAWCRSFWHCLAGLAGLATSVGLVNLLSGSRVALSQLIFTNPWGSPNGWTAWVFAFAAILLLGGLLPWARSVTGSAMRVALPVGLLTLAAFIATIWGNAPQTDPSRITRSPVSSIQPVPGRAWMTSADWKLWDYSAQPVLNPGVIGKVGTQGCPPGHAVEWTPTGRGVLTQHGRRIASLLDRDETPTTFREAERSAGYFLPRDPHETIVAAALPGRRAPESSRRFTANSQETPPLNFGEFPRSVMKRLDPGQPAVLTLDLTGVLYRYERLADVPLAASPVEVRTGNVVWRARRFPTESGDLRADLVVSHPAIGFATQPEEIRWDAAPLTHCRFFFHFPKNNVNVRVESDFYADGPLLSGAGWHRRILGVEGQLLSHFNPNLDWEGVRLIILRPVVVARIPAVAISLTVSTTDDSNPYYDFSLSTRYARDPQSYQENLSAGRPDPLTCGREEFGRWLRIPAAVFPWNSGSAHDLAAYAPRFGDVMAKVAQKEAVAEALYLGLPESQRHHVLDRILVDPSPAPLIDLAIRRGWAAEAKEAILERFNRGDSPRINPVMALEDPSTYPALLETLMQTPDLDTYEKIRLLPGIEPLLDQAVAKALQASSVSRLIAARPGYDNRLPYGPYLIAARRGNPDALDAVLAIFKAGGADEDSFFRREALSHLVVAPAPNGSSTKQWLAHLGDKTAADFQYDPLARIWRLR